MPVAALVHLEQRDEAIFLRIVKLGRSVGIAAREQDAAVLEQRGGVTGARLFHFCPRAEQPRVGVVDFGAVHRAAAGILTAAGDENSSILEQGRRVIDAVARELAGYAEFPGRGIVELGFMFSTAGDEHLAVSQESRGLLVAPAENQRTGVRELVARRMVKLGAVVAAANYKDVAVVERGGSRLVAADRHARLRSKAARCRVENLGRL
jgi:hypothetical protein